jgi:MFS family permease
MLLFFAYMGESIARGWVAFELTGSAAGLGGVFLAFGIALLIGTPLGGAAADVVSRRALLGLSCALLVIASLSVGLSIVFDSVQYWILVVAGVLEALAFSMYLPARTAYTAELLPPNQLRGGIVLSQVSVESMRVIAPAVAGVMIGVSWFGPAGVFLLGASFSMVAAVTMFNLPPTPRARGREPARPIAHLVEGVRYARRHAEIGSLLLTSVCAVMMSFPYLALLPVIADEGFDAGPSGYGVMSASTAIGAVAAGLVVHRFRSDHRRIILVAGLGLGGSLCALGAAPTFPLAVAALVCLGASMLAFQSTVQTTVIQLSEPEYHGRLQGLLMLGFGGYGLATLPIGMLADAIGTAPVLILMGASTAAIVVTYWFFSGAAARLRANPASTAQGNGG